MWSCLKMCAIRSRGYVTVTNAIVPAHYLYIGLYSPSIKDIRIYSVCYRGGSWHSNHGIRSHSYIVNKLNEIK